MPFAIIGDSIRETENGLEVTIQVARGCQVEFGAELGDTEDMDVQFLYSYLKRQYGGAILNKIRLVQAGRLIGTTTLMDLLANLKA